MAAHRDDPAGSMRVVVQRVSRARVTVGGEERGAIGAGLLLLVGVEKGDGVESARRMAEKIANLRIFAASPGQDERMDRSIRDIGGEVLAISQFTLAGSLRKGNRPSFDSAAPPGDAEPIYEALVGSLRELGLRVATGTFRAMMDVELVNTGPVTFVLERAT